MEKYIKELIKEGEGFTIEFKKTINSPEKIAKTLTAFANSAGGYILIGVDDKKKVIGVNPEEERFMVEESANFYCFPEVDIEYNEELIDDKNIVIIYVPESKSKPHSIEDKDGSKKVYVRAEAQCLLAAQTVVKALENEYPGREKPNHSRNEITLIDYLKKKQKITVKEYAKLINVSRRRASKIIFDLVSAGELYEHDFNENNFYTLSAHRAL